jgi:hypothetical protein
MNTIRKALRDHISKIDYRSQTGQKEYFIKPRGNLGDTYIQIRIYRDEFPPYMEGRKYMDQYIDHIGAWFEKEFPKASLLVSIDYRKKSNMKNLEKYP